MWVLGNPTLSTTEFTSELDFTSFVSKITKQKISEVRSSLSNNSKLQNEESDDEDSDKEDYELSEGEYDSNDEVKEDENDDNETESDDNCEEDGVEDEKGYKDDNNVNDIQEINTSANSHLGPDQNRAFTHILESLKRMETSPNEQLFLIIHGGPGTEKSIFAKALVKRIRQCQYNILCSAPT